MTVIYIRSFSASWLVMNYKETGEDRGVHSGLKQIYSECYQLQSDL